MMIRWDFSNYCHYYYKYSGLTGFRGRIKCRCSVTPDKIILVRQLTSPFNCSARFDSWLYFSQYFRKYFSAQCEPVSITTKTKKTTLKYEKNRKSYLFTQKPVRRKIRNQRIKEGFCNSFITP